VSQYIAAIKDRVQRDWVLPPTGRRELRVTLRLSLSPGGEVLNVHPAASSGDLAFDRAAIAAVHRASPLPVPDDPTLFDQSFRNLIIEFQPEDVL
jgi:colicin import membrane protein